MMIIPILRAIAWLAPRDTHACIWEKRKQDKDTWLKMAPLSTFVPFDLVLANHKKETRKATRNLEQILLFSNWH